MVSVLTGARFHVGTKDAPPHTLMAYFGKHSKISWYNTPFGRVRDATDVRPSDVMTSY